jgi:hypothetical protein
MPEEQIVFCEIENTAIEDKIVWKRDSFVCKVQVMFINFFDGCKKQSNRLYFANRRHKWISRFDNISLLK